MPTTCLGFSEDIYCALMLAFCYYSTRLVEYGAPVWVVRFNMTQIMAFDKIQMQATEMIEDMSYIEYSEVLNVLRLPTLSY